MDPLDTFIAAIGGGRRVGGQLLFRCPAHADKRPSLAVRELDDGRLLVKCFAGCATGEVLDALGLDFRDLYPAKASSW